MVVAALGQARRGCFPVAGSKPATSRTEAVEEFTEAAREKVSDMGTDNHADRLDNAEGMRIAGHCWTDRGEWIAETYGDTSDEYYDHAVAGYEGDPGEICILPADHFGPHKWTPIDQIVVSFSESPLTTPKP